MVFEEHLGAKVAEPVPARMRGSVIMAQHIRRRFTILDVALRIDALDRWTDAVPQ